MKTACKSLLVSSLVFACLLVVLVGAPCNSAHAQTRSPGLYVRTETAIPTRDLYYAHTNLMTFSHQFDLTVVHEFTSQWMVGEILARIERVARVLDGCGVMVARLNLVSVVTTRDLLFVSPSRDHVRPEGNDAYIAGLLHSYSRPALFYVEGFNRDQMPAVTKAQYLGFSGPLMGTAWVAYENVHRDPARAPYAEAQAIARILSNGDVTSRAELTAYSCSRIHEHPAVQPLTIGF